MTEKQALSIVAINGTFAPKAAWAQLGSEYSVSISSALHEYEVDWHAFSWTGENSHTTRERAANKLAAFLASGVVSGIDSPLILIAHSHGGNVALMALVQHEALRRRVAALICLATPFISTNSDEASQLLMSVLQGFRPLRLFVTCLAYAMLSFVIGSYDATWDYVVLCSIYFYGSISLAAPLAFAFRHAVVESVKGNVRGKYRYSVIDVPILVLRTGLDEALNWVRFTAFVANSMRPVIELARIASIPLIYVVQTFVDYRRTWIWLFVIAFVFGGFERFLRDAEVVGKVFLVTGIAVQFVCLFVLCGAVVRALVRSLPLSWGERPGIGARLIFAARKELSDVRGTQHTVVPVSLVDSVFRFRLRHSLYFSQEGVDAAVRFVRSLSLRTARAETPADID